ncbi:MAG TPA: 1,4-dihydroxy-2-naphthoate polyprenyltransferase [Myxococcaceae bacterium]|nr:1,4-dihydroxy-2-naphthoate polyprenyltransferase [Myxococcaceae bacterium]
MRVWLLACRPATLVAAFVPVAVGTACAIAEGHFRLGPALAALLGAVFIQIGTNLANDVYDFERGADTAERLGPTRAVQAGLLTRGQVRGGMVIAFGLATLAGAYLTAVSGPWVVAVGLVSIACGVAYTGGPFPLGYHGLGDVFVLAFFGVVAVGGTARAETGQVSALALWASLPVGALATAILVVNNLRDRETDAKAGKRTLAVRWGATAAVAEYALLLALAYAVPVGVAVSSRAPGALLPLLTVPLAVSLLRAVARERGRDLNRRLGGTARLLLLHGIAWAVGLSLLGRLP